MFSAFFVVVIIAGGAFGLAMRNDVLRDKIMQTLGHLKISETISMRSDSSFIYFISIEKEAPSKNANLNLDTFEVLDELSKKYKIGVIANQSLGTAERLEQKGYNCEIKVENRQKQQDVVQEFLEQESSTGKLHRYSFDVKA